MKYEIFTLFAVSNKRVKDIREAELEKMTEMLIWHKIQFMFCGFWEKGL